MTEIRVLLIDDQVLLRSGIRAILESEPGIEVVGEGGDGQAALDLTAALKPDVVCLDVQMPGMDGLTAASRLAELPDPPAILMLTTFNRDDYLFAALEHGASGFLLKNSSPERLIEAVQVVARGDALLSPDVTRRVIEHFTDRSNVEPSPAVEQLTEREREVLELIARGLSNSEIAKLLFLGEATVKTHVSKVLLKLGLRDRIQAVVFAYEHGITVPGA